MFPELIIACIAGLGGMLGWGLADFFAKKTIDQIGDVQSLAWAGIFGCITFAIALWYEISVKGNPLVIPHDAATWAALAFFGVLQGVVYLFAYKGFGKGQVALLNPFFASFPAIVAVVSIIFLGEVTTAWRIIALCVIFFGVILISIDAEALRSRRIRFGSVPGFKEVLIATLLAALWTILWSIFVSGKDPIAYAFYMFVFMTVTVFATAKYRRLDMRIRGSRIWLLVALIGICETVAYLSITWGYGSTGLTSIVAVLSGGFSLPTIVLAYVFLKEKLTRLQWVGCLVIIAGAMLMPLV